MITIELNQIRTATKCPNVFYGIQWNFVLQFLVGAPVLWEDAYPGSGDGPLRGDGHHWHAGKEYGDTSGLEVAVDGGSSPKPREPLLHLPHVVGPQKGEAVEIVVFLHLLGVLEESREVIVEATDFVRCQGMVLTRSYFTAQNSRNNVWRYLQSI